RSSSPRSPSSAARRASSRASGLPHHDDRVARSGDGAADDQQAARLVGLQDHEVLHGHAVVPLTARHAQSFENAAGRRARADRALTAQVVRTVGLGTAGEVVQVDRALEALALRDAGDDDLVAGGEAVRADLLPLREAAHVIDADLAQVLE